MAGGLREGSKLLSDGARGHGNVELRSSNRELARIQPREIEEIGCELRQPFDLGGHLLYEIAALPLVEILPRHELEEATQREQRRAQLMRSVRDELPPRMVELGQT